MEGIDNKYIENAIAALETTLGVKDHVDDHWLVSLLASNKVKECIGEIARYLGLPIQIDLSYVPRGYRADSTDGFSSASLVRAAWGGRGGQAITAQVSIPEYLPLYGTPGLGNFPIRVKISRDCTDNAATFIAVMAHELSHVVLHSCWHKEKDNEVYTDLTAMMLGFAAVMNEGRKAVKTTEYSGRTETQTTTYGYLSDGQFAFAYGRIEAILRKYWERRVSLSEKTMELEAIAKEGKKTMEHFQKYLAYVDKKLNQKMSQEDGYRICAFHQAGYADEFEQVARRTETELQRVNTFLANLNHYNEGLLGTIKRYEEEIRPVADYLASKHDGLRADVTVLKRHVSFMYRLKVEGRAGLRQHH
jgi:hypothetical protein